MKQKDAITFTAIVAQIRTMADGGIRITLAEFCFELGAPAAQADFIKDIQRCAKLLSQRHAVTAADNKMPFFIHLSG